MVTPIAALLAALVLLAVPGPTNTLLATAAATIGFRRALPLVVAEVSGYAVSISALVLVAGPLVRETPLLALALKIACALYLVRVAWRLWGTGLDTPTEHGPVSFRQVLTATLLNPKGLIFAFNIIPPPTESQTLPIALCLPMVIVLAGTGWVAAGALARRGIGSRMDAALPRRIGATAVLLFAIVISASALAALP